MVWVFEDISVFNTIQVYKSCKNLPVHIVNVSLISSILELIKLQISILVREF